MIAIPLAVCALDPRPLDLGAMTCVVNSVIVSAWFGVPVDEAK